MEALDKRLTALRNMKVHEAEVVAARRALEDEILAMLAEQGHDKGTLRTDRHKVVVRLSESFKLDERKWRKIEERISADLQPVRAKLEADPKGCKYLAEHEPALWEICATAIERREGRTSLSVELIEEGEA